MRRIVPLLMLPFLVLPLLAQEEMEEEGCGCGCGEAEETVDLSPPEGASAEKVEDKVGNFSLDLPPGWSVGHEPQDQPDVQLRLAASRDTQSLGEIMRIEVRRVTTARAETFTVDTPADVLQNVANNGFFEQYFGRGSARVVRPDVDAGQTLGGAEKSSGFEFRSITMQEQEKIDKALKLRGRGDKTVEVPEYKPLVVRGRMALLSPHIYLVTVEFRRSIADEPAVIEEYRKILESWKFYEEGEKPPPLQWQGKHIKDTTADPANAEEREDEIIHTTTGNKVYKLKLNFVIPPGFQRMEEGLGGDASLALIAQDKRNNWVQIILAHQNANALGEKRKKYPPKKQQYTEWASNWQSKARGVKMRPKPSKVKLGKVRGDGYEFIEGTVEKFRGTFTGVLFDKSGWRTFVEMETRGNGDKVFKEQIDDFFKSLKLKKIK